MSLDVSLYSTDEIEVETHRHWCPECGDVHDCPGYGPEALYDANITHNLGAMATAAGIYKELWRPEELGITCAQQLIEPLEQGLARLVADPAAYKQYDAANGWGTYAHFVPFVRKYLAACKEYPTSRVEADR
jgi:hypothetical protein